MALGNTIQYAGQYNLRECHLLSSTGVTARLDANVIEINLYENIFTQSIIGSLFVTDQNNLIANMPIVGQEFVSLKLETPGVGVIDYTDNIFCVQKISSRKGFSVGSEVYEINLISPEALRNNRTRVSKSFTGTDSEIVTKILKDEKLINTKKQIHVDETNRIRKYVAPNTRPNDFINYLTREATSKNYNGSPHYFFYENIRGFNFRVLDSSNVTSINTPDFRTTDPFILLNSGSDSTSPFNNSLGGILVQTSSFAQGVASGSAVFANFKALGDTIGNGAFLKTGWAVSKGNIPFDATSPVPPFNSTTELTNKIRTSDFIANLSHLRLSGIGSEGNPESGDLPDTHYGTTTSVDTLGSWYVDTGSTATSLGGESNVYLYGIFD